MADRILGEHFGTAVALIAISAVPIIGCGMLCRPDVAVSAGAEFETTGTGPGAGSFPLPTTGQAPTGGWASEPGSSCSSPCSSAPNTVTDVTGMASGAAPATATESGSDSIEPGSGGPGDNTSSSPPDPDPECGNWVVELGEECDDGDGVGDNTIDGCAACLRNARFAFVSSAIYPGEALTQEWADAECAILGEFAGYADVSWRAWLSSNTSPAGTRIGGSKLPYLLLNGVVLANSAADLSGMALLAPFNADELGTELATGEGLSCAETNALVWTFTSGGVLGISCENSPAGTAGNMNAQGVGEWSAMCELVCASQAHLYCVEWSP